MAERPDLALVAAELLGGALQAIRRIAAGAPGTRVIVFTAAPSGDELLAAVLAGAVGYLSRDTRPARLPVVLRAVLDGEGGAAARALAPARGRAARARGAAGARGGAGRASLTDREWEILDLLAAGLDPPARSRTGSASRP